MGVGWSQPAAPPGTQPAVAPPDNALATTQAGGAFRETDVPGSEDLFAQDDDFSSAFERTLDSTRFVRTPASNDVEAFLVEISPLVERYVRRAFDRFPSFRVAVFLHPIYEKITYKPTTQSGGARARTRDVANPDDEDNDADMADDAIPAATITEVTPVLRTALVTILRRADVPQLVHGHIGTLRDRHINFMRDGSGMHVKELRMADVQIAEVNHLAYAGRAFIPLPAFLASKKAIVNVRNADTRCFGYAILSALHPAQYHPERAGRYDRYFDEHVELRDLTYPVEVDQFQVVEDRIRIPFNVYTYYDDSGRARYPLYLSHVNPDVAIDLLYFEGHFAWIKNFSRFLGDQNSNEHMSFYCKRCLGRFSRESALTKHKLFCVSIDGCKQIYTMPAEGTKLKFYNVRNQTKFPFAFYADFEALTIPWTQQNRATDMKNCYQKHMPISVGLKLVSSVPGVLDNEPYETYTSEDVCAWFLNRLLVYRGVVNAYLFDERRMIMTDADKQNFSTATICYICRKPFPDDTTSRKKSESKVHDHDHISGIYRGAAHSACNLKLRRTYTIPVFLHNFRGYDSHLIVPAFTQFRGLEMKVIGQGLEKYLTLTWDKDIVFKDSLAFLSGKLEAVVACLLKAGKDKFRVLRGEFRNITDEAGIDMLLRKGVYPYDYMDSATRFDETELPPRASFFNRLTGTECSEADYEHARRVWDKFNCTSMLDYHNLYLKTDVLLLADVFESYRDATITTLGLDPSYYVSAPHLSWDCMMKMTDCRLTLLTDPMMFMLVQTNLRGGISMISKRYAKANNTYMGDAYDPTVRSSFILYTDANNLYGMAMSEPLPYDDFKWLLPEEFEYIDWTAQHDDQEVGYFVECDLHYPDELHDEHNDYPLAPERIVVEDHLLSDDQHGLREHYTISHSATSKLIPNFFDKTKMLLHYRNLRFYLLHGMVLTRVHRVISFKQARWLEPYIRTNTELRATSKDPIEVKLRKDMVNVIYGKTCENLTKRTDIRLVNTRQQFQKLIAKPQCIRSQIFAEDLVGIELQKVKCMINRPTYVGFAVLELSKLHMYKFHYDHFTRWYPNAELLFTDTDSLVYQVFTTDLYADLAAHREHFDFSNYPDNHMLHDDANRMVVGKMKDEAGSLIITEFVGLRPKMYSYRVAQQDRTTFKEHKRAKGIQRAAMTDIVHTDYVTQLRQARENYVNVRRIGQKHHRVFTIDALKRGLCSFDDKRYLREDGIMTYAHGHQRIRTEQTAVATDEEMALTSHHTALPDNAEDAAENILALSHADAEHLGMQQQITEDEALAIVAGMDLPGAVQYAFDREAATAPNRMRAATDADNEDDEEEEGAGRPHVPDRATRSVIHVARSFATNDMF